MGDSLDSMLSIEISEKYLKQIFQKFALKPVQRDLRVDELLAYKPSTYTFGRTTFKIWLE